MTLAAPSSTPPNRPDPSPHTPPPDQYHSLGGGGAANANKQTPQTPPFAIRVQIRPVCRVPCLGVPHNRAMGRAPTHQAPASLVVPHSAFPLPHVPQPASHVPRPPTSCVLRTASRILRPASRFLRPATRPVSCVPRPPSRVPRPCSAASAVKNIYPIRILKCFAVAAASEPKAQTFERHASLVRVCESKDSSKVSCPQDSRLKKY